jgi:hypothetical protein
LKEIRRRLDDYADAAGQSAWVLVPDLIIAVLRGASGEARAQYTSTLLGPAIFQQRISRCLGALPPAPWPPSMSIAASRVLTGLMRLAMRGLS